MCRLSPHQSVARPSLRTFHHIVTDLVSVDLHDFLSSGRANDVSGCCCVVLLPPEAPRFLPPMALPRLSLAAAAQSRYVAPSMRDSVPYRGVEVSGFNPIAHCGAVHG